MGRLNFNCSCANVGSVWVIQPPESQHAFRVSCAGCRKYIKWGSQGELDLLLRAGENVTIREYEEPPQSRTLDELFGGDGDD